jgi:outer membrane receptor protein involved in Fe transport
MTARLVQARALHGRNAPELKLFTATCGVSLLLAAGLMSPGLASAAEESASSDEQTLDEVTVVGSRIRRDTFNSPAPVTIVTREETVAAGFSTTTEVLQSSSLSAGTSQINNAFGGFVIDGGPGVNTLSLRGLGATRTLILINGRRVAPAGTRGSVGSADLNVLPGALVDRIEILKDGASSIYGSDAVAGVVNIITKQNASGLTVEGNINQPFEGAGEQVRASAVFGRTADRWSFSGSAEFYRRSNVTVGDRDWASECPFDKIYNPVTGAYLGYTDPLTGSPKCWGLNSGGVTINTIGTSARAGQPAIGNPALAGYNRWRPNSSVTNVSMPGFEGVSGGSLDVRDTFHPDMLRENLISPVDIWTGFLQGSYDLQALGNAELYGELLIHNRKSDQIGTRQLILDYRLGSPLIPANLTFSNFSPPVGGGMTGTDRIGVRVFGHYGTYESAQSLDYLKPTLGMRGDLPGGWRYDAYASYSKSNASYMFEVPLISRLTYASDVVAVAPGAVDPALTYAGYTCRINQTNFTERCFPLPPLNAQTIGGTYPDGLKQYISKAVTGVTEYKELLMSAVVDGDLYQLPYGTIKGVVGVEHRRPEIHDQPDPDMVAGNLYGFTTAAVTRGKDNVTELFGEVEVPLLADMPYARELTLNASYRWTDYKSYGADSTWKLGMVYSPVSWASLRSTMGTSYRAPALFEQFLGATSGFVSSTNDPCNNWDANPSTSNIYLNCQSEGLPTGFTATSSVRVLNAGGAAGGLAAENSDSVSAGIILEPTFGVGGDLSLAVDFFELRVDDGVDQAGFGFVLSQCYNDPDFASNQGYCGLVERDSGSRALTVTDGYVNLATDIVRGFEYQARYEVDIGTGTLRFNAAATQLRKQGFRLFETDDMDLLHGTIRYPEWTGSLTGAYTRGLWQFTHGIDVVGKQDSTEYFGLDPVTSIYDFSVGTYVTHFSSVRYRSRGWEVTVGARNLFDKKPPQISAFGYNRVGNAPLYSAYDYVGRRAFINVAKEF